MSFWDDLAGNGDSSTQEYLKQALQQYQNINVPTAQSEEVSNLPQETVQGTVSPEQIQAIDQDPSAYNNISLDPTSRQAVVDALKGYQSIANSGGLDADALLGIHEAENAATTQAQGEQGAIQRAAQAMGQGGGDFALTQRALAAQGASNTAATQGLQQAAEAEANREAALTQMGNIGTTLNSSDYNQEAQKASAQNAINATDQGYRNAANTGNVANNMTGQQFNVSNAQGVNAANTTAKQNNAYYNASLPQQQFNNELAKASGAAGVNNQQATAAQNNQNQIMGGLGKVAGAGGTIAATALGGPVAGATAGALLSKNNNASAGVNAAHGGVVCYAKGGVSMPHDHSICMKMGGHVGGEASVPGDSEANDTVPAMLSPGELVIPRSVPKDGPHMEEFARNAPVNGDTKKKVDLASFTKGYRRTR